MWGGGVVEIIRCFLAIASVMLASDSILVMSEWCDAFLGRVVCVLLLMASWRYWAGSLALRLVALAGLCAGGWFAFSVDHSVLRLLLVAWVIGFGWLAERCARVAGGWGSDPSWLLPVHFGALIYAVALAAYERIPAMWFALRDAAGLLSNCSLGLRASPVGMWMSGLPIYVFGSMVMAAALTVYGPRARHIIHGGALLAGLAAVEAMLGFTSPITALKASACQLAYVGLVAFLTVDACTRTRGAGAAVMTARACQGRKPLAVSLGLTLAGLLVAGLPLSSRPELAQPPGGPSILLCPKGFLDWRVPDFQKVGLVNAGMFGLFRQALERRARASGGRVVVAGEEISARDLTDVGVVVVINPTGGLSEREVRALEGFVRAGGGLLALGDHTNIGGSMEHLNSILAFTGIRFNFDSAVPMRPHWQGCLEVRQHPVTSRLAGRPARSIDGICGFGRRLTGDFPRRCPPEALIQTAVGASLAIELPAYPIVVGRYGFADAGDSLNSGMGAYMGSLAHERGETVGDVVLVAAQEVGRGRVLVFGDTSPFQNGALFLSQGLVSNAIHWLAGNTRASGGRSAFNYADEVALIDFSLRPRAKLTLFDAASLGGLANCLARARVVAVPAFSRDDWTAGARFLFLVSPTWFGRRDADRLTTYIIGGGNVILAQGYALRLPCQPLLSRFGLAIEGIPLGAGEPESGIVHKDAWAISCLAGEGESAPDIIVRASAFGHPTVVTKRIGKGSLTLISDGRFFLDENLEGEQRAEPRNLAFVDDLVSALRAESPQHVGSGCDVGHASAQEAWASPVPSSP